MARILPAASRGRAAPQALPGAQRHLIALRGARAHPSPTRASLIQAGAVTRRTLLSCCGCGVCGLAGIGGGGGGVGGWLDCAFAASMNGGMDEYEASVRPVKERLFAKLLAGGSVHDLLEVGVGTGPNLSYYATAAAPPARVVGVDPNPFMRPYLERNAAHAGLAPVEWVAGAAEALPFGEASFDAAVFTLVLCSVVDVAGSIAEARRVLRPGGRLLFIEHTASARPLTRAAQALVEPLQRLLADGCHLTRDPLPALEAAGFASLDAERFEVAGASLIAPHVAGIAVA